MRSIHSSRTLFIHAAGSFGLILWCIFSSAASAPAQSLRSEASPIPRGTEIPSSEQRTARYLESIRKSPPRQLAFFLQMPKGGDLHNHLSGSIYAESFVQWAADKGLCVHNQTYALSLPPCNPNAGQAQAGSALTNPVLYRELINAWSMRFWQYAGQSGHDQFFDSFGKFGAATYDHTGRMIADAASRAARGRVLYLELMLTPDGGLASHVGEQVGWDGNPESTLAKLKAGGIADAVAAGVKNVQDAEAQKDTLLQCGTPRRTPAAR